MHQLTPERQFADLLRADPARPFVTYYDEASGERSELSAKSLANWVAKTHHLLGDELGLGVGDTALLALPAHWISVPIVLGCLTAGLELTTSGDADVAFVSEDTASAAGQVVDVYAIAAGNAALGLRDDAPAGVQDYVAAVRPQPDAWAGVQLVAGPGDPCLPGLTRGETVERASAAGLPEHARLLTTRAAFGPPDWVDVLFAPLAVQGSVVIVRNCPDESVLERRAAQERVTARA
ncbi:MAG TPA: TIGR03089 family protein [Jatrophihabitans sp.]|nr:TIGR03089 family protein [Jatrophihabitans sp.]